MAAAAAEHTKLKLASDSNLRLADGGKSRWEGAMAKAAGFISYPFIKRMRNMTNAAHLFGI